MNTFYVLKLLAMSWIMPSLALLLHIALSMTACSYMIRFYMYLEESSVTGNVTLTFIWPDILSGIPKSYNCLCCSEAFKVRAGLGYR